GTVATTNTAVTAIEEINQLDTAGEVLDYLKSSAEQVLMQRYKDGEQTALGQLGTTVFNKHHEGIKKVLNRNNYSISDYLDDTNFIINNGTFVPKMNGFIKLIPKTGKNSIRFGFVGLDRTTGEITTFHIKLIIDLIKRAPSLGFEY
ncbi:MAG: hypothetical protein FWE02_05880, partial [Defluviitaleaceae bacterium]|nr:hypothetical protein [Defluviitaleaceae bacterium]